jgi:hypothetical protein
MSLDLSEYELIECRNCLTVRDVTRLADLYVTTYLCDDNRGVVAFLLQNADDLTTACQELMHLFLTDGYDPTRETQEGLTEAQRHQVLVVASTCAYNATLFVQEAQRRRVKRASAGWDPLTTPVTA